MVTSFGQEAQSFEETRSDLESTKRILRNLDC